MLRNEEKDSCWKRPGLSPHLPPKATYGRGLSFPVGGMGSKVERAQKGGNLTAKAKAPRAQGLLACYLCCRPPGRPVPRGNSCPSPRAHSPPGKPSLAPTRVSRVRYPAAPRSGRAVFYLVVLPQDWVGGSARTPEEEAWLRPSHGKGRTGPLCGLCSRSNPAPAPAAPRPQSLFHPLPSKLHPAHLGTREQVTRGDPLPTGSLHSRQGCDEPRGGVT